jgi:hypothetical protein
MLHNGELFTRLFNTPFFRACDDQSVLSKQPTHIKLGLRAHQLAVIQRMMDLEKDLSTGLQIENELLKSRFAVLGDAVGVGKSLMVLGHISRNKESAMRLWNEQLNPYSNRNIYSTFQEKYTDLSNCSALLVVPHTLYRQWQLYIDTQTTLKPFYIKTKRNFEGNLVGKVCEADIVVVSNTLLGNFLQIIENKVWFTRTYIDEADTIHISSTKPLPQTNFIWFITASWPNLLFENERVWLSQGTVQRITASPEFTTYDPVFQAQMLNALVGQRGYFNRYYACSPMYFREYIRVQHPYRSHIVVRCKDSFIEQSISLPPLFTQIIQCEPSLQHRIVNNMISQNVQDLLNAGDTQAALQALGVPTESPINLIQAVTENRMKELDRLKRTYEFKSQLEYSSATQKEIALNTLQQKITSLQEQIDSIKKRIENYSKEICAICYDEPTGPVLTPCCSRIFCATCILMSLSRIPGCPLCRAAVQPNTLHSVSEKKQVKNKVELPKAPPKKIDALLDLLRKHPKDKFLVFSRYENPFRMMSERLETDNISVQTVKGNKDVISNMLNNFDKGDLRVLLLNSNHAGAGLNITSANYVVLWHAMSIEEEKQILGRAYRMGRTQPLHFIKLVHPDEIRT